MALETVVLTVGGRVLSHVSCTLTMQATDAVREASFDVAYNGPGVPCEEDEDAIVTVSGEVTLTGYSRDVKGSHDEETRSYTVTVVSRTIDATEASIDHPTGLKKDCDLKEIAEEFDTVGIGIECDAKTLKKRLHKVRPGETLFETLETDARAQGVLIYDTPKGKLKLTDKPEGRHAGALVRGLNIKSASGTLSGRGNFSEVKVRGQSSDGTTSAVLRPEAEAKGTATRKRPLIRIHEGEATSDRMKKRAAWEAKRSAGAAKECSVTVPGWRDAGGKLFAPNFLIEVRDDWLGIEQDMIIASVTLRQDSEGGTEAVLTCKDPRALGGENPRGKSAKGWGAPAVPTPTFRDTL
ncbi:hypothetical protein Sa4125_25060 [Aureimonas sp. SA4125]|uniref:phage baseplate assembly protein n=1 Tax=Aureimonas sp. SA4125 TaxID=2826993 RepID=UPI001CC4DEF4|nr:hypothetical protein [Aureimonas sp. SA4125]BDA84964.1 hypothetical protein Sa4125_25060 [Aureimonas sp. SA4125]